MYKINASIAIPVAGSAVGCVPAQTPYDVELAPLLEFSTGLSREQCRFL